MEIEERVHFQNTHWGEGKFTTFTFKRNIFRKVWQDIDTKPIALITGPRRVGKSVLIKQLANELINNKGIDPKQILFFEFSTNDKADAIWQVFNYFKKEVSDPRIPIFLFFDEIQYIDGYESVIKEIYDNSKNCKIFITGSLSLSYKRNVQESLAGRFFSYRLFPLNFSEYLELSGEKNLELFKDATDEKDIFKKENILSILNAEFRKFLNYGRFPEIINFSEDQSKAYMLNIISQSLNQDVFTYFEIEKPLVMNNLFNFIRENNGGLISINKLANQLGTANQTITLYISILEQMGLIYLVYNSTNPLTKGQTAKKAYINSGFALLETKLDIQTAIGFAVESYILERLLEKGEIVTFWRKRSKEIDFLVPKRKTAFEVKFRNKIPKIESKLKGFELKVISLSGDLPACLF